MKENLRSLIARGKTKLVIEKLRQYADQLNDNDIRDEVLLLSSRFENYSREFREGVNSTEENQITLSKINRALIELISNLPENSSAHSRKFHQFKSLELIIDGEPNDFNETRKENLIGVISAVLNIDKNLISIKQVLRGSILLIIELPAVEASRLIEYYYSESPESEKLKGLLKIKGIKYHYRVKKSKIWEIVVAAGVIIGILGAGAEFIGINLRELLGFGRVERQLQLTVYIHGPKGPQDIVLENTGKLIADFGNRRDSKMIGQDGRTNFGEIDQRFLGKSIGLSVDADGFEVTHPDSVYLYDGEPIYLEVQKDEKLGHIFGFIRNENGYGISDAEVLIDFDTIIRTDSIGRFMVDLPNNKIKENYQLSIRKQGYNVLERTYYPNSNLFIVQLERSDNQ